MTGYDQLRSQRVKSYVVAKHPPAGVMHSTYSATNRMEVSSKLFDCGSKLRDPSQSSPRVASEREVNITKLLMTFSYNLIIWHDSLHYTTKLSTKQIYILNIFLLAESRI
ncbi:hypothetical protein AVEN_270480-1 [Araneus ventricosus]|uniref:Uncharacterized protein n=1 Tax=Araneus ventricosus TaxID=182803 RepID=A0A4Y2B4D2_ARAVE|nr:hypothetical protein AVEN_270480-1 [Araneus ventricosus]